MLLATASGLSLCLLSTLGPGELKTLEPEPAGEAAGEAAPGPPREPEPGPAREPEPAPPPDQTAGALPSGDSGEGDPWIKRHKPRRGELEIGPYFAGHWTSRFHRLQDDDRLDRHYRLAASPQLGLRIGMYPLTFLGFEAEGGGGPVKVEPSGIYSGDRGVLVNFGGHVIAQLPLWNAVPFVTFGGGLLALRSPAIGLGNDVDGVVHFGVGAKLDFLKRMGVRLEYRHTLSRRCNEAGTSSCALDVTGKAFRAHNPQIMVGLFLRLR